MRVPKCNSLPDAEIEVVDMVWAVLTAVMAWGTLVEMRLNVA